MLNNKATPKPSTLNPLWSRLEAINIIDALITNKNKPKETTVIGRVRNTNRGFKKILSRIITKETIIASDIPLTDTPGINEAIKKIARASDIILTKNRILKSLLKFKRKIV